MVTSINLQKPEQETTYLYSLPAEDTANSDDGGEENCCQTADQH